MKKIRQISSNPVITALILFNFIFVSCSHDDFSNQQTEQNNNESISNRLANGNNPNAALSGKELFKEIAFGSSNNLNLDHVNILRASIESFNESEKLQYQQIVNTICNKIDELNPQYFNNFRTNLNSKNYNQINTAIESVGQTIETAMMAIPDLRDQYILGMHIAQNVDVDIFVNPDGTLNQEAFKNCLIQEYGDDNNFEEIISPTFVVAGVYVLLGMNVAAGVNIAVVAFCWRWVRNNCNSNIINNTPLSNEILVNQIYEAL